MYNFESGLFSRRVSNFMTKFKNGLKRHIESIHEGIQYLCNQCGFKSTQKGSLQTHIVSIH